MSNRVCVESIAAERVIQYFTAKDFVKCFGHKLMFDNILKLFSDNCRACVHRDISVVVVIS